jgi:hypothetical protein
VAALIDVSKTVRHRLQYPIEFSRIVNAAEQRRISRGDGQLSHVLYHLFDKSADGLHRHEEKLCGRNRQIAIFSLQKKIAYNS